MHEGDALLHHQATLISTSGVLAIEIKEPIFMCQTEISFDPLSLVVTLVTNVQYITNDWGRLVKQSMVKHFLLLGKASIAVLDEGICTCCERGL